MLPFIVVIESLADKPTTSNTDMTSICSHLLIPEGLVRAGFANLKSALLEPILVIGACLFWLAILPITGGFCASVALFDKIASLRARDLRPFNLQQNPLVLRAKSAPGQKPPSRTRAPVQAFQF